MTLAFLASVMEKATLLEARHLVLPASKNGEIAFDDAEAIRRIEVFFVKASRLAARYRCKLHLKPAPHRFFDSSISMVKVMRKFRLRNCGLWFDLAHDLVMRSCNSSIKHGYPKFFPDPRRLSVKEIKNCFPRDHHFVRQEKDHASASNLARALDNRIDFVALSAPGADHFGRPLDLHRPMNGSARQPAITAFLKAAPLAGRRLILDIDADLVRDYDLYFGEWEFLKATCRKPI
ncbi:MAG: hypothetical protein HY360_12020 [Verrucomicrobia bacterium]|nr:hypothetical protein [Verrucomicrobiota bacterium]